MSQNPSSQPHNEFEGHAPHKEADDKEEVYFEGSPMLRGDFGRFLLAVVVAVVLFAIPYLYWQFTKDHLWMPWWANLVFVVLGLIALIVPIVVLKSRRYRISNYRIDFERGILGKRIDTLELWHVDDVEFVQSFMDRLLGVGTIIVFSNDSTTPRLPMHGLPNPRPLFETLKQRIIAVKRQRGVVKMDMGGHMDVQ